MYQLDEIIDDYRFIAITIPGFGGSSLVVDRKLEDWPKDVIELLVKIGISIEDREFFVVGGSFGSIHALSMLNSIECKPGRRKHKLDVKKYIMMCPAGAGVQNFNVTARDIRENFVTKLVSEVIARVQYFFPGTFLNSKGLEDCLPKDEYYRKLVYYSLQRSMKYTKRGYVENLILLLTKFPLQCSEDRKIKLRQKVALTFGGKDEVCDRRHLKVYLDGLNYPEENVIKFPNEGHCHCIRHFQEIIKKVVDVKLGLPTS